ncbi:MAG: NADH-quinone oxidoreductase subunit L [Phycisphaeraceae bacterium]|nr:NADH-quinone oxidoreductase subunit L [Phycisphaeraceae bacterium]
MDLTSTQQTILALLVIAWLAPLASAAISLAIGSRLLKSATAWMAVALNGVGFLAAAWAFFAWNASDPAPEVILWNIPWIPLGDWAQADYLYLGVMIDSLTVGISAMVMMIATLVHVYSIGYMSGDKRYERFFTYLSLFVFSMMGIVVSNSIMQLFVFWELVGLTSYLLIGFWFENRGPQLACKKAFVMNRIGDAGFLVGFGILFYKLGGNLMLPAAGNVEGVTGLLGAVQAQLAAESGWDGVAYSITNPPLWLTIAGIGLFFGAIGKSAQFPLHTWLPDAMEGPTPVSSIVHSATMVAAGVYLTARIYPILTPGAHLFIATIGLVTLVMAACMALVMTDIKRVLAYSTLSQLGYMILGLGAGAYAFALFHLITHAFFKCCLFQCSGSVIEAAHHEQDMKEYGGLGRKMPITMACYGICTLAIAGASLPFTNIGISGYYSKDGIIAGTINYGEVLAASGFGTLGHLFWIGPTVVAYITVFYMARSFALTFLGEPRNEELYDHAHEVPWTMTFPQVTLAVMAIIAAVLPFLGLIAQSEPAVDFVQRAGELGSKKSHGMHLAHVYLLHGVGWILALAAGIVLYTPGFRYAKKIAAVPGLNLLHNWFINKFYFDALFDVFTVAAAKFFAWIIGLIDKYIVDGLVNLTGWVTRGSAWGVGRFDQGVVDGAVNGAASLTRTSGQLLRFTQLGRVRGYVLMLLASTVLITLVVITLTLVTG